MQCQKYAAFCWLLAISFPVYHCSYRHDTSAMNVRCMYTRMKLQPLIIWYWGIDIAQPTNIISINIFQQPILCMLCQCGVVLVAWRHLMFLLLQSKQLGFSVDKCWPVSDWGYHCVHILTGTSLFTPHQTNSWHSCYLVYTSPRCVGNRCKCSAAHSARFLRGLCDGAHTASILTTIWQTCCRGSREERIFTLYSFTCDRKCRGDCFLWRTQSMYIKWNISLPA